METQKNHMPGISSFLKGRRLPYFSDYRTHFWGPNSKYFKNFVFQSLLGPKNVENFENLPTFFSHFFGQGCFRYMAASYSWKNMVYPFNSTHNSDHFDIPYSCKALGAHVLGSAQLEHSDNYDI